MTAPLTITQAEAAKHIGHSVTLVLTPSRARTGKFGTQRGRSARGTLDFTGPNWCAVTMRSGNERRVPYSEIVALIDSTAGGGWKKTTLVDAFDGQTVAGSIVRVGTDDNFLRGKVTADIYDRDRTYLHVEYSRDLNPQGWSYPEDSWQGEVQSIDPAEGTPVLREVQL